MIAIVAIVLPIPLSFIRYIPGLIKSRGWAYAQSILVYPSALRAHHRRPAVGFLVPTRGQAIYIFLVSFLNLVLLLAPYVITQPQASFSSRDAQTLSIVGNRAGVMAMGNAVALFLFSARNNVLLGVTDWSYGTYILLHRILGYWAVFLTILHSFMLLVCYVQQGTYADELARLYWVWGIVGTVAASVIFLSSVLWIRQRLYEFFLASHIAMALLFILGYYYHIWYVYGYDWGYEIWIFIAGGIWGADRLARVVRMAIQGSHTATVAVIENTDGEYLRIEVQGKYLADGVAYLCFPTFTWRFWETHPFSVAFQSQGNREHEGVRTLTSEEIAEDPEKSVGTTGVAAAASSSADNTTNSTTFFTRRREGITKKLAARAAESPVRLRVLIDGPYDHSGRVMSQLAQCGDSLCITGGVGITACLPYLRRCRTKGAKLFWSSRQSGLVAALAPALSTLPGSVRVETTVGDRLDLDSILRQEMLRTKDEGPLGIVVSGPPAMADDVRQKVVTLAREDLQGRPYVLLDEAFSW